MSNKEQLEPEVKLQLKVKEMFNESDLDFAGVKVERTKEKIKIELSAIFHDGWGTECDAKFEFEYHGHDMMNKNTKLKIPMNKKDDELGCVVVDTFTIGLWEQLYSELDDLMSCCVEELKKAVDEYLKEVENEK